MRTYVERVHAYVESCAIRRERGACNVVVSDYGWPKTKHVDGHAIVARSAPGMNWVTGNTITIDGGEQIAGG